jgi:hypothetical protein
MDEQRAADLLDDALAAKQGRKGGALPDAAWEQEETADLLALASRLQASLAPAPPSRGAVARTRARVLNRTRAARRPAKRTAQPAHRPTHWRRYAFALASLALIFTMLASGTGVAYAAGGALPGDGLYGVKLGLESARLALTFSPEARSAYARGLADERLSEIQALLQDGRTGDLPAAVESYNNTLNQLEQTAGDQEDPNLQQDRATLEHHLQVLQALLTTAPESAKSGLENALQKSRHGLDVLDAKEQGIDPSQLAPGQLKKTPSPEDSTGKENQGKGPPGQDGSPGNGNGPPSDHTPGPPGGPPGQSQGGGPGSLGGNGPGSSGNPPGQSK